jgi:hypothetical protein
VPRALRKLRLVPVTPKSFYKSPPSDSVLDQIAAHDLSKDFTRFLFNGLVFGIGFRDSSTKQVIEKFDCPLIKVRIKFFSFSTVMVSNPHAAIANASGL